MKRLLPILAIALSAALWLPAAAQADFGIKSLDAGTFTEEETPELRAGARPYEFKLAFEMNQDAKEVPEGTLRELVIDLPPGMVGNPLAAPKCSGADFEGLTTNCPGNTQIGVAFIRAGFGENTVVSPIYNLTPPMGVAASVGFSIGSNNVFNEASLRSGDYGVRISDITIPTTVQLQSVDARIWGVPAAADHDPQRICIDPVGNVVKGCASDAPEVPFLSLPTSCGDPLTWTLRVSSVQEPEAFESASAESEGPGGTPRGLIDCDQPPFDPSIALDPETSVSDSPTGLHVNLHVPQNEGVTQVELKPRDEVQRLRIEAESGGFELSFKGQSTAAIPFDASAAEVQSTLGGLSTISAGNVLVSGEAGSYLISFVKALSQQDVPLIEAEFSGEGEAEVTLVKQGRPVGVLGPEPLIATAHLKDTVVTLPQGLAVNPSAADGLAGCPLSGPQGINLPGSGEPGQSEAAKCPDNAKIGTVEVQTPLVDHPLKGAVYLAKQGDNPFDSLLAIYIAVNDPETGVVVKLAGRVEPDPVTGQLRTTFQNNPQLPFEDFELDFFGGPRGALTTPPTCGKYTTTTELTPWTSPEGADAFPTDSFQITGSPNGSCPNGEAGMPNNPDFEAGTVTPLAGAYSPFVLRLRRVNGEQRFKKLNVTLPPGLAAKLAGVQECPEALIAQAQGRGNPGEGALEQQSPSCPQSSEVGAVNVGAGSGSPLYVQGKAYLAGPYKGAPLSLAIVTPAVAGPFDLGAVVVRSALHVDPTTAQVSVKSDPIPQILEGIPLDVRSIAVQVDRDQFALNPTSCEAKEVGAQEISNAGATALLANRFQVGGCSGLAFKPKLSLKLKGGTKRGAHPSLRAILTQGGGQANIARAKVTLPKSEFLDQGHIRTVCTRVQFAAEQCPKGSVYGFARAFTPLLDNPLEGPVYLRSSSNELPDLVADLNGQVQVVLVGRIDSVRGGGIRNSFEVVPDAPVSKFVLSMQGGSKGLLINSTNLCKATHRANARLLAQNGRRANLRPVVGNGCGKQSKRGARRPRR
jgi:hypothetical protein